MMDSQPPFDWSALVQAVLSILGAGFYLATGVLLLILAGAASVMNLPSQQAFVAASLGWSALLIGVLNLPSALHAIGRLSGRALPEISTPRLNWLAAVLVLFLPLLLVLGNLVAPDDGLAWLLLPPLQLLVVGIPLLWLYRAGSARLPGNPPSRQWALVSFGLVIVQMLAIVLEVVLLLGILTVGLSIFSLQPGAIEMLERLTTRLTYAMGSPEALMRILEGIINHPLVLFVGIALTAVLIPLLEELLKPLGLWFFGGRQLTPAQGFQAGMLAGLTFALMESLGNLANPLGDQWALVAVGRLGTGVLHITTSALVGWGMASAWRDRRYWHLSGAFLLAVFLHGCWNLFGILLGLAEFLDPALASNVVLLRLGGIAPFAMGVLMITMVFILMGANRRLRAAAVDETDEPLVNMSQITG
ncbi:MAG: PrsW family intramembrane metalloprotease [Anaerolineae bacterium]|nr:PrsW family intramembrane metalloprotease [Anaerolineae bacterium]